MSASFDIGGLRGLIPDMDVSAKALAREARSLVEQSAIDLRDKWRENARETAGEHGRLYPDSIRYQMAGNAYYSAADIAPDPSKPQGGMSFEYGSANQPPHLDGQRALDELAPRIMRRFDSLAFLE